MVDHLHLHDLIERLRSLLFTGRRQPRRLAWRAWVAGVSLGAVVFGAATPSTAATRAKVSLAVMGDSNTLSYQDRISLPNPEQRGGTYRAKTLQWGEIIARLRPDEVDPGPWEESGVSNPRLRWYDVLGLPIQRAPRKQDYRYNFANDGAACEELMITRRRQAPRLVAEMDREPQRWRNGVVVLRFGLGELSKVIELQAQRPGTPQMRVESAQCLSRIREAVALIHTRHPDTRIVLVGVFEDSHDAVNVVRWQSAREIDNIARMCDEFDDGLRAIAAANPGVSFFDDRAWFRQAWGGRDAQGSPAYKTIAIGPTLRVTHAMGDAPTHSMLGDDHNGLVWNALWAQALVRHLHDVAGLPVTPIRDDELERFVRSLTD